MSFPRVVEHASSQDIVSRWIYKGFDTHLITELKADIEPDWEILIDDVISQLFVLPWRDKSVFNA